MTPIPHLWPLGRGAVMTGSAQLSDGSAMLVMRAMPEPKPDRIDTPTTNEEWDALVDQPTLYLHFCDRDAITRFIGTLEIIQDAMP